MNELSRIKVWDPFVRVVHWGLVAAFGIAYFTEDDIIDVHVAAGYTVLALVLCRIVWGFIGGPYARFSSFVSGPRVVMAYLRDVASHRARRYLGHNPAGGAMIVLLLIALLGTTVSGLAVYAADEQAGLCGGSVGAPILPFTSSRTIVQKIAMGARRAWPTRGTSAPELGSRT